MSAQRSNAQGDTLPKAEPNLQDKKFRNYRYFVLLWVLLSGVLNYMDRSAVGIAAPHMIRELGLTNTDIGLMGTMFSWTYAVFQLPAGYLVDKIGVKRVYVIAVGAWSIATSLMGFGHAMAQFLPFRFLLGVGESPNSPLSSKLTTQWFSRKERGQASGIWDSGSKWGLAVAPPILTAISLGFGWRVMFFVVGALGILLAACFWAFYRSPESSKRLSMEELKEIRAIQEAEDISDVKRIPWLKFFAYRQTWGLMLGFFTSIWIWNIFINFMPLYLQDSLHVTIAGTGWVAAIPYVVAALGDIYAGHLTLTLARRSHLGALESKRRVLVACCALVAVALALVPIVRNLALAIVVLSVALALIAGIQSQSWAATSDIVADSQAAQYGSIMNFGGYFGGALAPVVTGILVDHTGTYSSTFLVSALIALSGCFFYGLLVKKPIAGE